MSRKALAPSRPDAPRCGAPNTRHRAEIRAETDRLGWSFAIHRTDRPATDLLLWMHNSMGAGPRGTGVNRWHGAPLVGGGA